MQHTHTQFRHKHVSRDEPKRVSKSTTELDLEIIWKIAKDGETADSVIDEHSENHTMLSRITAWLSVSNECDTGVGAYNIGGAPDEQQVADAILRR